MTEDIPLDITGHEERERPEEAGSKENALEGNTHEGTFGDQTDSNSGSGDEAVAANRKDSEGSDGEEEPVEPVEVLVQLAKDGDIDPWDIDIVEVTDKFLARLDEADLRTSGRALFYASVLLRMKGDAMLQSDDEQQADEPEPWEAALASDEPLEEPDPFASLEQEIDRRLERKRARGMPQTLDELVRDLREAERESWWKHSREYDTSESPSGYDRGTQELDYRRTDQFRGDAEPTESDVTGTTHGEDIDELIDAVYRAIRDQYDKGRSEVLFNEIADAGGSRVRTYLGLLFLSHRGQVHLQQDELFGDLWIQDPSVVTGSGEVLAD